jgi:predicted phosphodiesterase
LTGGFSVYGPAHLLAFHGSPRSNDDVISRTTPESEFVELLPDSDVHFAIGGHTHIQMDCRFGSTMMVNPGSVGLPGVGPGTPDLPVNRDVAWAEYAVLTIDEADHSIDLRRTGIDLPAMLEWAKATGMPAFDWWRAKWRSD